MLLTVGRLLVRSVWSVLRRSFLSNGHSVGRLVGRLVRRPLGRLLGGSLGGRGGKEEGRGERRLGGDLHSIGNSCRDPQFYCCENTPTVLHPKILRCCSISSYQETEENTNRGVDYMCQAAEIGERAAMLYMAKAFETGEGLGTAR